jgi:hypothetical protein
VNRDVHSLQNAKILHNAKNCSVEMKHQLDTTDHRTSGGVDQMRVDIMASSSRIEEPCFHRYRRRNGRQDWTKIKSMPDLFIRPDQRGDIKTFTSGITAPAGSSHGNRVVSSTPLALSSRWDGSGSSHAVELTPPTLKGLISPSCGRRHKLGTNLKMMTSIQPAPSLFEEHQSDHSGSSMPNSWSATRQPKKSAMKKSSNMMGRGRNINLEARFHASSSAIEDYDFFSSSIESVPTCSLDKNHSSLTVASLECTAVSTAASASECRWKAWTGPLNESDQRESLPVVSPICPKRQLTSYVSDGSLSCPPPLTTYNTEDDDTCDKSVTSFGSIDLALEDYDDDHPDDHAPTKAQSIDEQEVVSSIFETESKRGGLSNTVCSSYYSITSEGSTSTIQPQFRRSFQFETPKLESEERPFDSSFVTIQTSDQALYLHSNDGVTDGGHKGKCTRKHSPTCVTKELDIVINGKNLRSCKAMNPKNWTIDQIGSWTTPSQSPGKTDSITINHATSSYITSNEMPPAPSLLVSLPFNENGTQTTTKDRTGESTAQFCEDMTSAAIKGNDLRGGVQGLEDTHALLHSTKNVSTSLHVKQTPRGSTGTGAKRYEECITSSCDGTPGSIISTERTGSTGSLVQRWEAKIREMNARTLEEKQTLIDADRLSNVPNLLKATTTKAAASSVSEGRTKPSWQQGRQTRRGSTGSFVRKFEEKFALSSPLSSRHDSSKYTTNALVVPNKATAMTHKDIALKRDSCESQPPQSSHTPFETFYGSVALNDELLPQNEALYQEGNFLRSSAVCSSPKPTLQQERYLSPRRWKVTHEQRHQPNQQQHDTDLTPKQGSRARRRGSTGALAKKFEEELIPATRPSPRQKPLSPQFTPTTRRRGSIGVIAGQWEEHASKRVSAPPLAT